MTMTIRERVKIALDNCDCEKDDMNKLVALAYYMGREEATRQISDKYSAILEAQHQRAEACRYHKMAAAIVGDKHYIYSGDYSGDMTAAFGNDVTEL